MNVLLRLSTSILIGQAQRSQLSLANTEHIGAADGTHASCGATAVLNFDGLRALDLPVGFTLRAVGLHGLLPIAAFGRQSSKAGATCQ